MLKCFINSKIFLTSKDSCIVHAETWELCFVVMVSVLLLIYHTAVGKSFNYIYFRFLILKKRRHYLLHMLKALLNKNILSIIF